ncbi:MAG: cell division suppressor protein YneA [Bacillota bacterium]
MRSKRYVIVDSRRFFLFITFVVTIIVLVMFSVMSMTGAYSMTSVENFEEYWIKQGDTLWDIASRFAPEGYDTRKFIYDIKEHNEMDTSMIFQGDKLLIPMVAIAD